MLLAHTLHRTSFFLVAFIAVAFFPQLCRPQAALLMEEPYGFFGTINPTGHTAVYFERICADTPVHLRRCCPGEFGAVISRYQGIDGYDWVAIPLIPYLYSVDQISEVPDRVDSETVQRLRNHYREIHLSNLGEHLGPGNLVRGGWTQLVGLSYERRIYIFRFETSEAQDDAFIAQLNADPNRSHFSLLFNNCSDFARRTLDFYFPGSFRRNIFPDAGLTTPKQTAHKLERYARKHPQMQLTVFGIAQVPGYRRKSRSNKGIAESLATTTYAVPIALANPYLAGGLFVDYLVRGRYRIVPQHTQLLLPEDLRILTAPIHPEENLESTGQLASGVAIGGSAPADESVTANSGLSEIKVVHE